MNRALATLLVLVIPTVRAPAAIVVDRASVDYTFGQQIVFQLDALADSPIARASLFFLPEGSDRTSILEADFTPGPRIAVEVVHRVVDRSIAPFSRVDYWWQIITESGEQLTSEPQAFWYDDNRFAWQRLDRSGVEVNWADGDSAFGQAALDTAVAALARIGRETGAASPPRTRVYVYADTGTLQAGLRLGGRPWTGGHAEPSLGVVLVAVAPGSASRLEFEREIPHELTHVLLHQRLGPQGYAGLPNWLNEGLAVMAEAEPEPAYRLALEEAADAGTLPSLDAICGPFPEDPQQALLAYAQSESVTRFILDRYGSHAMDDLLAAYADGATCASGVQRGLGLSLAELQQAWLTGTLRANPVTTLLRSASPYAVILLLATAPWALLLLPLRKPKRSG